MILFHLWNDLFINSKFNKAKLVAKRIKREKRIKRGDVFRGYNLTIYTPIDPVQVKDNQAKKQSRQWTVR